MVIFLHNIQIKVKSTTHTISFILNIFAKKSFAGDSCEINIDECADDPCLHGDCIDMVAAFQCNCHPGWQGENCEVEINECDIEQPCGEHGTCLGNNYLLHVMLWSYS